jgi:hypothetical protein
MRFFQRKRQQQRTSVAAPHPPVDELMGDADARRFSADLAAGHWQDFHSFLERTRDWDDRAFYVRRLSEIDGRPDWLDDWLSATPDSAVAHLFNGTHMTRWAWQERGSGYATNVKEDSWAAFHRRLLLAERALLRATELDPEDPTPYAMLLQSAMGLSLGGTELRQRFDEVVRRRRWHRNAHSTMIQGLAAKWLGSHAEMFEFARSVTRDAPDGSGVHVVVCEAHLELWLNLPREGDNGRQLQTEYFSRPEVQREVSDAAGRSVLSVHHTATKWTPADLNIVAMCFWLMKDYTRQLHLMDRIGTSIQKIPWAYQGNPAAAYARARTIARERVTTPTSSMT